MIIQIRGTSGSGKTHVVRKVMEACGGGFTRGLDYGGRGLRRRKQPYYYVHLNRKLVIPGHYETACGGCDTLPTMDLVFDLVSYWAAAGNDVLFEGLLATAEVNRTVQLAQQHPLKVLAIDLPFEACLASVNARRHEKDPGAADVNPDNTLSKWKQTRRAVQRLAVAGVECKWGTREEVLAMALQALKISSDTPVNDTR